MGPQSNKGITALVMGPLPAGTGSRSPGGAGPAGQRAKPPAYKVQVSALRPLSRKAALLTLALCKPIERRITTKLRSLRSAMGPGACC